MDIYFLSKCFVIGFLSSCMVGPIFILIFNRSALCGIRLGIATAFGASLGDTILYGIGLAAALPLIGYLKQLLFVLNGLGGIFLVMYGLYMINKVKSLAFDKRECQLSAIRAFRSSITITLINPLALAYFIGAVFQVVPDNPLQLTAFDQVTGFAAVFCGSFAVFSTIVLLARSVGKALTSRSITRISYAISVVFIVAGLLMLLLFLQHPFGFTLIPYDIIL